MTLSFYEIVKSRIFSGDFPGCVPVCVLGGCASLYRQWGQQIGRIRGNYVGRQQKLLDT